MFLRLVFACESGENRANDVSFGSVLYAIVFGLLTGYRIREVLCWGYARSYPR